MKKATAVLLDSLGIRVEGKNDIKVYAPSAESLFKVYLETQNVPVEMQSDAMSYVHQFHSIDFNEFSGIAARDLKTAINGQFNTKPFIEAQKLIDNKFTKVIPDEVLTSAKRTRFLSEHDGEIDFDRIHEIAPFHATRRVNSGVEQMVDLTINVGVNCGVSAKAIAKYGAVAWSVVDLLERHGIQVNLKVVWKSESRSEFYNTRDMEVVVKEAGHYTDLMSLARVFTPWYFRRCMFTLACVAHDSIGKQIERSLGKSLQDKSSASRGKISLGVDLIGQEDLGLADLKRFIEQSIIG